MDKLIKALQSVSLSGQEIMKLISNKANLISYDELKNVRNIDEIMKNGACVILYLSEKHYGHWICVFYTGKKSIEFFDPYGVSIDLQKNWVTRSDREKLGVEKNYLSKLLADSNCEIEYNHHKFQKKGVQNAVCGRWVAIRLLFRHLSLEEFSVLFNANKNIPMSADMLVTMLTTNFFK